MPESPLVCPECGARRIKARARGCYHCPDGHGGLVPVSNMELAADKRQRKEAREEERKAKLRELAEAREAERLPVETLWSIDGLPGLYTYVRLAGLYKALSEGEVFARSGGVTMVFRRRFGYEDEVRKALGIETKGG